MTLTELFFYVLGGWWMLVFLWYIGEALLVLLFAVTVAPVLFIREQIRRFRERSAA